jgi:hypothetical protein
MSQPSFDLDFDDRGEDDGGVPTYSVGELADAINGAMRRSFHDGVWVRGEIHRLVGARPARLLPPGGGHRPGQGRGQRAVLRAGAGCA